MTQQKPGTSRPMRRGKNKQYELYFFIETDLTWGAGHCAVVINANDSC